MEHDNQQVVTSGFRCLKLVVSNYIDRLSQQNFVVVLNAIHMYAKNTVGNINNNLTAIALFQNVADFTAKTLKNNDQNKRKKLKTWKILFERIENLGYDHRAEVRRTNILTAENIIMTHGVHFEMESAWAVVLTFMPRLLDHAYKKYSGNITGEERKSFGFAEDKKAITKTFNEASVVKAMQEKDK